MIALPPSLLSRFRTPSGTPDYLAVLRAPNDTLLGIARQMPLAERAGLYHQLRRARPGFLETMAASAAGVDLEAQRRRLLAILDAAAAEPVTAS